MSKRPISKRLSVRPPLWHLFVPKLVTVLRQGYGAKDLQSDAVAGLTVAIVALPLSMALAIASGATPDKGIFTAIVAGFLISLLGGSRYQIGGPTGAFVVVVFNVIATHGYDGLVLATLMAGIILIGAGLFRFGTYVKYIPQPVVTGFTAGIAVIIFSSQVKDLLGLQMDHVPADFFDKWTAYGAHLASFSWPVIGVSGASLALIIILRRLRPTWPGFLLAVAFGSVAAYFLHLPIDTIGSRFGGIPESLPNITMPDISMARLRELMPSAFTIAFLAGVESLLSAVVADGMTSGRHRSNSELVAQGVANCASALFGGLPATGAIARTATSIRSGAQSPVAGMLHAVFLLLFVLLLAPLASYIPLASLAAILVIVAWNMSEIERFRYLMLAPVGDRVVLLLTFGLTVVVDLTVAIEVGVVLASVLFVHRMTEAVEIETDVKLIEEDVDDFGAQPSNGAQPANGQEMRDRLPEGVEVFQLSGPFFFGAANRLRDVLERTGNNPKVYILRMRMVPMIDATGASALQAFAERCKREKTTVILSGVQAQPRSVLRHMGLTGASGSVRLASGFDKALELAKTLI
jgi:SulP family sulfate permease